MKIALPFAVSLFLAFLPASAHALHPQQGGSLFSKSQKAKHNGPVGCLYLTLTTGHREAKTWSQKHPDFGFTLQNQAAGMKYDPSWFRLVAQGDFLREIKLPDEYGDTFEACLVPGDYMLEGLAIRADNALFRIGFSRRQFEPIPISLKAEDSIYLGNFYLEHISEGDQPGLLVVRDRFERDRPFILNHGKHRLRNSMRISLLEPGNHTVIVKEQND